MQDYICMYALACAIFMCDIDYMHAYIVSADLIVMRVHTRYVHLMSVPSLFSLPVE